MRRRKLGRGSGLRRWLLALCLPLALVSPVPAQDTGQVCALSFIDSDADGARGADEKMAAKGISASLQNAAGVTIASLLLEASPYAADGLLCFDDLLAGDYQISLRSSEFTHTTSAAFPVSVRPGAAPTVVEFGAQPLPSFTPSHNPAAIASVVNAILPRLIGGLVLVVALSVIGLLATFAIIRRRSKRAPARLYRAPVSAAPSADPPRKDRPGLGSPPLFADDDLDAPAAN